MNVSHILRHFLRQGVFLFLFLCLFWSTAARAEPCTEIVATAVSIQGMVEVRSKASAKWEKISAKDSFCTDDRVRTLANSRAALQLNNDSILRLNENSSITFSGLSPQGSRRLNLKTGIVHFISRLKQRVEVVTPYVNAAVDGTEFVVAVEADQTQVTVFEGQVRAYNDQGEITLGQGETALALSGEAPLLRFQIQPWNAVSWALYYPAVINFTSLIDDADASLTQSLDYYRQGQISAALESLADDLPNSNTYVYRAALYLTVGQIDSVSADLEKC